MLGIEIIDGFTVHSTSPIDKRIVKATVAEALQIPLGERYDGLEIWITSIKKKYRFEGGTASGDLKEVAAGSSGGGGERAAVISPEADNQTVFDLSSITGSLKKVSINGVLQTVGQDYTYENNILTFTGNQYALDTNDLITLYLV